MKKRLFHYSGPSRINKSGESEKFWEIGVAGTEVTIRFGKTGANGQTTTKSFGTPVLAKEYVEKSVASKLKDGYVESGSIAKTAPSETTKPSKGAQPKTPKAKATVGGPVDKPKTNFCTECGNPVNVGQNFCGKCGNALAEIAVRIEDSTIGECEINATFILGFSGAAVGDFVPDALALAQAGLVNRFVESEKLGKNRATLRYRNVEFSSVSISSEYITDYDSDGEPIDLYVDVVFAIPETYALELDELRSKDLLALYSALDVKLDIDGYKVDEPATFELVLT